MRFFVNVHWNNIVLNKLALNTKIKIKNMHSIYIATVCIAVLLKYPLGNVRACG